MNKPYTPEELQGKFVTFSKLLSVKAPGMETVNHATGPRAGMPYLYNSEDEAKNDKYFCPEWDQVIPAMEYFEKLEAQKNNSEKS
jgi:hypothetical protein